MNPTVSVVIPTIGRPESLERLFASIAAQSVKPTEVLVADASEGNDTETVVETWRRRGFPVSHTRVQPPNAVRQRMALIAQSTSKYLLLLDDDVALDPECLREMIAGITSEPGVVAVVADFSNQDWSNPTRVWRWYMRYVLGMRDREWEGKVVGPLLRFCYPGSDKKPRPMDWIGAGTSLVSREAYDKAGGFSDFFLHRCTMNEDVDLGLKLGRVGKILFWPAAKLAHFHAPSGRVTAEVAAEDDLFNRFTVLNRTMGKSTLRSLALVTLFLAVETSSNLAGVVFRWRGQHFLMRTRGRLRGYGRVLIQSVSGGRWT